LKKIKELYEKDKPREKLALKGAQSLKNEELMAVLLGSGVRGKDVRKLSREIVSLLDSEFDSLSLDKLLKIHGLGKAKASQILAAIELSRRYLIKNNKKISSAKDVFDELIEYTTKNQEHFILLTLDGAGHLINKRVVFKGTLNQSLVHPREVFADAIADRSAAIIIAHNHPSGSLEPSVEDIEITKRLSKVADIIGIDLIEHIIISKNGYFSFVEEGILI
jgi:DNA repair protein RadC